MPRFTVVTVLPTLPFWLQIAIVIAIFSLLIHSKMQRGQTSDFFLNRTFLVWTCFRAAALKIYPLSAASVFHTLPPTPFQGLFSVEKE
jgi:hypothetical protein